MIISMISRISIAIIGFAVLSSAQSSTSTSSSTRASPTFACPANNGQTVTDPNGVQYIIACSSDTSGSYSTAPTVTTGFDDCFALCDATSGCNAASYVGGTNGVGAGICYLKLNLVNPSAVAAAANTVGLIRYVGAFLSFKPPDSRLTNSQGLPRPLQHRQPLLILAGLSK